MTFQFFITVILCIAVCFVIAFSFWFYGIFRYPLPPVIILLINASIPFIMVIGLLPYDVSLTLFGEDENLPSEKNSLYITLEVFYWLSNIFSFLITPVVVSVLSYSKTISVKHRIWMAIYDNLVFYGSIIIAVVIGLILLLISGTFSLETLPSLIVALTNAYGLLIFCLVMGHGLVSFPLTVWRQADYKRRYFFYLSRMAKENNVLKKTVSNGRRILEICFKAREQTPRGGHLNEMYEIQGRPREARLTRLTYELPHIDFDDDFRHKGIERMMKIDWSLSSTTVQNMEDFFALMDNASDAIDQANKFIVYSGQQASDALKDLCSENNGFMSVRIKKITQRILSVLYGIMSLIVLWGELIRMIKPDYSLFHLISHLNLSPSVGILFITAPVLIFQSFVGSWSLTHFRIGSFFRFIEGATSVRTFSYWTSFVSKLAPTIGYHYLTQIEATKSKFVVVMGVMDRIPLVGREVVQYSPILLLIIVMFVALNLWDKMLAFLGLKRLTFYDNINGLDDVELQNGEKILREIDPDVAEILDADQSLKIDSFGREVEILEPLKI